MKKRVLITGGSHAELPLIECAKRRGDYVITTGNNIDGLGHKLADQYVPGDYSDREFVLALAEREGVNAIVSGCNDFAYISTAYACEQLGIPGHDTLKNANMIHHKNQFRKLTEELNIVSPRMVRCFSREEVEKAYGSLGAPLMVKPVDLTGGKGVRLCENLKEALNAYEAAMSVTRENFVIVEEYVKGSGHGASVLLKNQKVVFGFVDNEQYYRNPYLVSGACFPSDVGDVAKRKLFSDIECIAEKLQLVDGIFHVQFILREDGTPVMIDPCRRAPGDLYIKLVQYATGVDYPEEILKAEYGEPLQEKYSVSLRNVARQCVMTDKNGSFEDIYYATELGDKIFSKLIWAKKGELIQNFMTYKAGILFLESEEKDALYQLVRDFHDLVKIITG